MEETSVNANYVKAFNMGYWLKKGGKEEFDKFLKSLSSKDTEAYRGYVAGGAEADKEKVKEELDQITRNRKRTK